MGREPGAPVLVFPLQPPPLVRCHLPTRGHTVGASCTRNCCSERSHSGGQKPLGCRKEGARVAVPEVNPRKWTFPQQPVPQTRSPTWTGGASFPPCLPAACFFSAPGSVGVAPGDPAQLGKREPLVGRRWRSAAAQGPGEAGAGVPEPGGVGAAALDGARGLHGGLGPCGRLRLPPGPLLAQDSPAALGRGDWAGRGRGAVLFL